MFEGGKEQYDDRNCNITIITFKMRDFIHRKKKIKTLKNFKIKSKENKISHGRGNSLRNI